MRPKLHLEGFGWAGSVLAWALAPDYALTWHDTEAPLRAWPASTGAILPSPHAETHAAWEAWGRWVQDPPTAPWYRAINPAVVEQSTGFWYSAKAPILHRRWKPVARAAGLQRSAAPSYHVNVPQFVQLTRAAFAGQRLDAPPPDARLIVAHGYRPDTLRAYQWGWSQPVTLRLDPALGTRPCISCRLNRATLVYAYPLPGHADLWMAGTAMILRSPAATPPMPDLSFGHPLRQWAERLATVTDGVALLDVAGPPRQGWRPLGPTPALPWAYWEGATLRTRPLGNSGVTHAPLLISAVYTALGVPLQPAPFAAAAAALEQLASRGLP